MNNQKNTNISIKIIDNLFNNQNWTFTAKSYILVYIDLMSNLFTYVFFHCCLMIAISIMHYCHHQSLKCNLPECLRQYSQSIQPHVYIIVMHAEFKV